MEIVIHQRNDTLISQLISDKVEIINVNDSLDLIGDSSYLGANKVIVKKENICPDFFDLRTGIAGEILQKFSNYRMELAIVGDFSAHKSKSLRDFINESNRTGRILFVDSVEEAIRMMSIRKS